MLNKPASKSIALTDATWLEVTSNKANKLRELTKLEGTFHQLNFTDEGLVGHYKVNSDDGVLFIKIINLAARKTQILAEEISKHLFKTGTNTVSLLQDFPKVNYMHNIMILGYPFIYGTYVEPKLENISLVSSELGKMHLGLKKFNDTSTIEQNSNRHLEFCFSNAPKLLLQLKESNIDASAIKETIYSLMKQELMSTAQPIHGDLNYGNILVSDDDKKIIFIDFEEATRSYFNPMVDVAMVIERFIKTYKCNQDNLLVEFKKSYINVTGEWFKTSSQLSNILRSLSARALLLLASVNKDETNDWHNEERSKFLRLHQNAIINSAQLSILSNTKGAT